MIITLILFVFILGLLVFVHELGHFIAAKKLGVKVEEFAFGFKPRIWSVKRGETTYAINAIPIGGYCAMYGEDEMSITEKERKNKDWDRSFMAKPRWARAIILVAGVFMNFVLAWLIFSVIFVMGFEPLVPGMVSGRGVKVVSPVKITDVEKNSPASEAGLKAGDRVFSVDGAKVGSSLEVVADIYTKDGKPAKLEIQRDGKMLNFDITPRKNPPEGSGPIGIGLAGGKIGTTWYKAPFVAMGQMGTLTKTTVAAFGNFIKNLLVKQQISKDVTGMVGVGYATDFVRKLGFTYVLQFIALISLSLGVMNLLPVVPLDGGHLLIVGVEAVRRKKLSEKQIGWLGMAGLGFILLLIFVTTYSDIMRFGVWSKFIGLFK